MIRFLIFFIFPLFGTFSKINYPLAPDPIDVVIPCALKDKEVLCKCIKGIRKYGDHVRRIIVVSSEPLTDLAEWFDEKNYPFTKQDLLDEIFQAHKETPSSFPRIGWIYQQFLKFYAFLVIPNISSNILILDADTIFLRPVRFIDWRGNPFFNWGGEYHPPYFEHAKKLLPDFEKVFQNRSGICHHMIFQKPILEDLFSEIVRVHSIEPWKAIARCIDPLVTSLSEYEIYFNFTFLKTEQAHLRKLRWQNIDSMKDVEKYKKKNYDYVSCHIYIPDRKAAKRGIKTEKALPLLPSP